MARNMMYWFGISILWFTVGCVNGNKSADNAHTSSRAQEEAFAVSDTLTYRMENFKEISPFFSGDGTTIDTTFYAVHYPVFSPDIDSLFRNTIFVDGEHTADQVAESFLGGFNEYAEEQLANGNQAFHAWFRDQKCTVPLNRPGVLTLRNIISEYTGGAHGIEIEIWSTFDTQEKRKLLLTDIFQDTLSMRQIAEGYFRKQEHLSDTSSYGNDYFFENEIFSLPDNFGLTDSGFLFHYNPYEIKSYADGPTTLLIPYESLASVMTEKGKRLLKVINGGVPRAGSAGKQE